MKIFDTKKSTQELMGLGMALHGDKATLETRIRGVFSRRRSARLASLAAAALVLALVFACFTTACQPVVANAAAEIAVNASNTTVAAEGSLLSFGGYAKGTLDGNRITVTDTNGGKHEFTWVDEGVRKTVDGAQELSAPIPEGNYAAPGEAALHAAETAVTIWGDAVTAREIHVNMYTGNGLELVYYGIGFDDTPFESMEQIYGYADAVTGKILHLDCNHWGQSVQKYGNDAINGKVRDWSWDSEAYAAAHTSEKALATAMELIRTCFPTGEIVPRDDAVWDAGSHTDGEQIGWNGGYEAIVDAYIRMDKDPCYYVQVAVPLEEGAEPCVTIFGCYPLGWDYCCNQIHDPQVMKQEMMDLAAIRNSVKVNEGSSKERAYPVYDEKLLQERADYAKQWIGLKFYLSGNNSYDKEFVEEQGRERAISMAFIDISLGTADPWSVEWLDLGTPEDVIRCALPGQTLEFSGSGLWAVYVGDGQCVYAKAEPDEAVGVITQASVADMMQGNHCHLQINDYMTVSPAVEYLLDPNDGTAPAPADAALDGNAARAEALQGTVFTPMAEEWKQGDSAEEFSKVFLVRIDVYPDDGYESSEPMHDPDKVAALARRGNVLRFAWGDQARYAVYLGDGLIVYADAEKDMTVRNANVADWLNDTAGKPNCTCSILTWR
ncbi:MAG: hypothetical protein IKE11_08505 [Clostridia bacterium]|nr:hypothetical protein [Clostridia bacterium]